MLTTIATFSFPLEAYIARSKLENEGIYVFLTNVHTISMQWLYSNALGGVGLQVQEESIELAKKILREDRTTDLIKQQGYDFFQCPNCKSINTTSYQKGHRYAFLLFILLGVPLWPIKNGIKCNDCHFLYTKGVLDSYYKNQCFKM